MNNSAKILIILEKDTIVWRKVEKKYLYADGTDYADKTACQDCHPLDGVCFRAQTDGNEHYQLYHALGGGI